MSEQVGKYYWLKLRRDFFKRHDIRIIEEMPNGKDYILFYLKLLLESIDHGGELRFNETIPYNEQMLSVITNTNIDLVRSAMKVFVQLKMIEVLDDETIFMAEVMKMTGSETASAERVRKHRAKLNEQKLLLQSNDVVTKSNTEIEKELDIEIEQETDTQKECGAKAPPPAPSAPPAFTLPLKNGSAYPITQAEIDQYAKLYPSVDILQELRKMHGWCDGNPSRRKTKSGIRRFIASWLASEQDKHSYTRQAAPAKVNALDVLGRMLEETP